MPGVGAGTHYKFEILGADGEWREKADPMAFHTEVPPATASVVFESTYEWGDDDWMTERAQPSSPSHEPMRVYEVHLGSWRHWGGDAYSYGELADELVGYVTDLGFTHVELMPVMEHPFGGSWGYQVTSYFAPTARFGDPDDFRYLVDRLHQAGIGVHPRLGARRTSRRTTWALARFDGTPLYEHPDPRRGEHPDWGTYVFNFGRREVRNFLVANALYWLEEFHIDGLRVDAVASMLYLDYSREEGEWTPNEYGGRENLEAVQFLQEINATVYKRVPGVVTIAEESTRWPGVTRPTHARRPRLRLQVEHGLDARLARLHPARARSTAQYHHHEMTFSLVYAYSENFVLPISHDEVVHGKGSLLRKMPGDRWQQLANLRAYLAFMWAHPGKQLLFMGAEFGQESEWAEARELDWWLLDHPEHRGVHDAGARPQPGLRRARRRCGRATTTRRASRGSTPTTPGTTCSRSSAAATTAPDLACVANFSAVPARRLPRSGCPRPGTWDEVLNTDAAAYAGSGVGNLGAVEAVDGEHDGQPASATLCVPPLATVWLRKRRLTTSA